MNAVIPGSMNRNPCYTYLGWYVTATYTYQRGGAEAKLQVPGVMQNSLKFRMHDESKSPEA